MQSSSQTYSATNNLARIQESGRIAIDLLSLNVRRAGYFGELILDEGTPSQVGGTAGKSVAAGKCDKNNTEWARMIDQPIFGLDDTRAGYACISGADHLRGDIVTVRYASSHMVSSYDDNRLYIRSALFSAAIFKGADNSNSANKVPDSGATDRELVAEAFYIGDTGRTCKGKAIPALYRVTLGSDGKPTQQELIAGAEHLQFQYLANNQYRNASAVSDWDDVSAVKVWVLMRNECTEGGIQNTETYQMGAMTYTVNDSYRRQLYSSVITLRNQG
jgi:type IV pilus assembly protein PilW